MTGNANLNVIIMFVLLIRVVATPIVFLNKRAMFDYLYKCKAMDLFLFIPQTNILHFDVTMMSYQQTFEIALKMFIGL